MLERLDDNRSRSLKRFWEKSDGRGLNPQHVRKVERILTLLEGALSPMDMNQPGFDFHKLSGENPPRWSVHVNGNWCVTFSFDGEDATNIDYEDYH
ncbi:MAG: type II toxin-antitoxin system RelE/ParE family toxin [Rhizobiaceae bacterium]